MPHYKGNSEPVRANTALLTRGFDPMPLGGKCPSGRVSQFHLRVFESGGRRAGLRDRYG